jgi:hypothetical protein
MFYRNLVERAIDAAFEQAEGVFNARFCNEFSYRFNRRGQQLAMFNETLKHLTSGEKLPYAKLTASEVSA